MSFLDRPTRKRGDYRRRTQRQPKECRKSVHGSRNLHDFAT